MWCESGGDLLRLPLDELDDLVGDKVLVVQAVRADAVGEQVMQGR